MSTNRPDLPKNKNNALKLLIFVFILFIITMIIIFYNQTSVHDDQMQNVKTSQLIVNYFYGYPQY